MLEMQGEIEMGRKLFFMLIFSLIVGLVAAYYGLLPVPWLQEGALETRDAFVHKSADVIESSSD